jgi:hexokinase
VSVPTKYMPGGGQNLQVEHWMYAVFPVKQNGPAARIPLSFSYSYPYNSKTLGDGTVAWSGTVTIIVGG